MSAAPILHATLIATRRGGRWTGALLQGPSGSGKSDLALRAVEVGWRLVADDRVLAWTSGGRLFGRAPAPLAGLVEARGLGVLRAPALPFAEIRLAVECVALEEDLERVPEPNRRSVVGLPLPLVRLRATEASAVAKLALALCGGPLTASPSGVLSAVSGRAEWGPRQDAEGVLKGTA